MARRIRNCDYKNIYSSLPASGGSNGVATIIEVMLCRSRTFNIASSARDQPIER
jgi:hypothetical protein